LIYINAMALSRRCDGTSVLPRAGGIMLTINGRPISFHEYRRHRRRRSEVLIPWAVLMTAAAAFWLLT
jgi:hypothetical protein